MLDKRLLESSELYDKRYKNFSVLLIFPITLLFLGTLFFSFVGKKELIITNTASVTPYKIVSTIRSTSNNTISENNLIEGEYVRADSLLLKYSSSSDNIILKNLMEQKQDILNKKAQLKILLISLNSGKNEFMTVDSYGYEKIYENYEAQATILKNNINKSNQAINEQNNNIAKQQKNIVEQISSIKSQINDYISVQNAISSNKSVSSSNNYIAQYNNYISQSKVLEENLKSQKGEGISVNQEILQQKETLKAQFISDISTNINNRKEQIKTLELQKSALNQSNNYDNSLDSQIAAIKTQNIIDANKELSDFNITLTDIESKIDTQKQNNQFNEIFAEKSGVLHVFPEVLGNKTLQAGTPVAQIFSELNDKSKIYITSYIPSSQISGIKLGQKIRFTIQQPLPKTVVLLGKIQKIDSAPTALKGGNGYKVSALVTLNKKNISYIRYGLEGKFVVVTGKKTYFNYYLDKIKGEN